MSNNKIGWDLDVLGPQAGPYKDEAPDIESRVDWSERFVSQHERDIKQTRYEAAQIAQELEKRIKEQGQLIQGQGRLIGFLADVLFAAIAALFAGLVAAYVPVDMYWKAGAGIFVFLMTLLAGNFLFRGFAPSVLSQSAHKTRNQRNRNQGI